MPYTPPPMPSYDPPSRRNTISPTPSPEALRAIEEEITPPPIKPGPPDPPKPREKQAIRRRELVPSISLKNYPVDPAEVAKRLL